ncbi:hypothetical protein ACFFJB_02440 [Camelimonas abortus]
MTITWTDGCNGEESMLRIPYENLRITEESHEGFRVEILPVATAR